MNNNIKNQQFFRDFAVPLEISPDGYMVYHVTIHGINIEVELREDHFHVFYCKDDRTTGSIIGLSQDLVKEIVIRL